MKKMLAVSALSIVTILAGCGGSGSSPTMNNDSTLIKKDSTSIAVPDTSRLRTDTTRTDTTRK